MEGVIKITPTIASPLEALESIPSAETKTTSNMDNKLIGAESSKNSKLYTAFSSDCMALENIAHEFECRDEQATNEPSIIDLEDRNTSNDGIETVLNLLDKNISSANISKNGSHTAASNIDKRLKKSKNTVAIVPHWTIGGAIDEFLRVHNCEPLLESDDESENESCYSRGVESHASGISRKVNANEEKGQGTPNEDAAGDGCEETIKQMADAQEIKLKSLQAELDAARNTISLLEDQVKSHIPSPTQISHFVTHKMLEAQLASTQQQLAYAKQDAIDALAEKERMRDQNQQLEDALNELQQHGDSLGNTMSGLNSTSTETCHNDPPEYQHKELDGGGWTVHQLRCDLNEAHSFIKRLKEDRARERKHYQRLIGGVEENKIVDLESRIKEEMGINLELRRKCYVLEQQMNAKRKMLIDFESENKSLMHEVDHLKKMLRDESKTSVEIECLQDINDSLNEELSSAMDENKRLRDKILRFKKVSSHKLFLSRMSGKSINNDVKDAETSNFTGTAAMEVINKDVFAKALEYLKDEENPGELPKSVQYKTDVRRDQVRDESEKSPIDNTYVDNEHKMMQESRRRFESLRSEFY